jgi:Mn2+/Fe2+ NRAMP family transporter
VPPRIERVARSPVVGPSKPRLLEILGPGLISGAADDDPSAIATYSQAGARFGYGLCWLMPLVYPLMVVVQQVSAQVGRTTGHGIAGNVRRHCPAWLLYVSVTLLLMANVIAIAADLSVMADALQLLVGGPRLFYVLLFGGFCVVAQIFMCYKRYVAVLKWTTLSLFAYFGAMLMVAVPWGEVAAAMLVRFFIIEARYLTIIVAIFGVALGPYLFFWQASQEVEDQRVKPLREPLLEAPEQAAGALERIRLDTYIGMAVATLVGLAIIITTGTTLHINGVTEVQTPAQAAEALRPISGPFAFIIFSIGIIGTGLLAIPVLAGSAAYAIGERPEVARGPCPRSPRGEGVLHHGCDRHVRRRCRQLCRPRSNSSALLERGHQRRCRHAHVGRDDVDRISTSYHGRFRDRDAAQDRRLDRHGHRGSRRRRDGRRGSAGAHIVASGCDHLVYSSGRPDPPRVRSDGAP